MMNVGLATSPGSSPMPAATPFARTVFPAPSSPHSARTSPGRARRASRSPIRSVCRDDWLTRSSERGLCGGSARRSALESAALKDEANGKAEERAEERRPDEQPPGRRKHAERVERRSRAADERREERDEPQQADDRATAPEPPLRREELGALLGGIAVGALLLRHGGLA